MNQEMQDSFTQIYRDRKWSWVHPSGPNSMFPQTVEIRKVLSELLKKYSVKSLTDLGCGYYEWMEPIIQATGIEYLGIDIVPEIIAMNREDYPHRQFQQGSAHSCSLPGEVIFCRDMTSFLSETATLKVLTNIKKSSAKWLWITSSPISRNIESSTEGNHRAQNLQLHPYFLRAVETYQVRDQVLLIIDLEKYRRQILPIYYPCLDIKDNNLQFLHPFEPQLLDNEVFTSTGWVKNPLFLHSEVQTHSNVMIGLYRRRELETTIPKIIHYFKMTDAIQSWIKALPDWEFRLGEETSPDSRYQIVYNQGGIFVDSELWYPENFDFRTGSAFQVYVNEKLGTQLSSRLFGSAPGIDMNQCFIYPSYYHGDNPAGYPGWICGLSVAVEGPPYSALTYPPSQVPDLVYSLTGIPNLSSELVGVVSQSRKLPYHCESLIGGIDVQREPFNWGLPIRKMKNLSIYRRPSSQSVKIPKIIHQIWVGSKPIPAEFLTYQATWKRDYPDWEYRLWTDANLPKLKNQKEYNSEKSGAGKADILRYEILAKYGGIYADMDFESVRNCEEILGGLDFFTASEDKGKNTPAIGIMGCVANSQFMKYVVDQIPNSVRLYEKADLNIRTGPHHLKRQLDTYTGSEALMVFKAEKFYPYRIWNPRPKTYGPGVYASHHWAGSWL